MKIAAGIVLYNPDRLRFKQCLEVVAKQSDLVILFDNSNQTDNSLWEDWSDLVVYLTEYENKGIAYALNRIIEVAEERAYEWVITYDQDTLIPINMVDKFTPYLNQNDVAIVCPQVIDKRRAYMNIERNKNVDEIDFCITSASCTNVTQWRKVGGFDEKLFIDFVDNDFCKRLLLLGLKILRVNDVVIEQEFGNISLKSPQVVSFYLTLSKILHNRNIAKLSYKKIVSHLRVYYVHRNLLYLNKKFQNYGGIGYENFYCKSFIGFLFYFSLPSYVRSGYSFSVLKSIYYGLKDGNKLSKNTKPLL